MNKYANNKQGIGRIRFLTGLVGLLLLAQVHASLGQTAASATYALTVNNNPVAAGQVTAATAAFGAGTVDGDKNSKASYGMHAKGFSTSKALAVAGNDYFEFAIAPVAGQRLSITGISLQRMRSTHDSLSMAVYYSTVNPYSTSTHTQLGSDTAVSTSWVASSFNPPTAIQVSGGATFRLRIYGWSPDPGTYLDIKNLVISGTTAPVNVAPSVAVLRPSEGDTFLPGRPVVIEAEASDDSEVVSVAFYVNGTLVDNDPAAPYTASWTAGAPGSHTVTAAAVDDTGLTGVSLPVEIAVVAPTNLYVDLNYSPTYPGDYVWGVDAFDSIQDAVDAALSGATVWVADGVYDAGSVAVTGMPCRVAITKPITVSSLNGSGGAVIVGQADAAIHGPASIRCAYVGAGATLKGFTLDNGHTQARPAGGYAAWWIYRICGGGAFVEAGGLLADCTVADCTAVGGGGGVYLAGAGATLRNSLVFGNTAGGGGGGVCAMTGALVESGTLAANDSAFRGGGLWASAATVRNSIVWDNTAPQDANYYRSGGVFDHNVTMPLASGPGNRDADPLFVGPEDGNFALAGASPCLDAGTNQAWMAATADAAGNPRLEDGNDDGAAIVDIGALEAGPAPNVAIVANGFGSPLTVARDEAVRLAITANAGRDSGNKDWWLLALAPDGATWYSYDLAAEAWKERFSPAYQGPFVSLGMTPVFDGALPEGTYTVYIGVDATMDGELQLDTLIYDAVEVTVR